MKIVGHSADLYADKETTPELKQRKTTIKQPVPAETRKDETVVHTSQVEHSYDFKGGITAKDIYEALLDPRRADIWSHGKSKVSKKMGSEFQLFDGNVHGRLVKAVSMRNIMCMCMYLIVYMVDTF